MATKLTAKINGQVFARRTDRTYTHVVICKGNKERDLKRGEEQARYDVKANWKYYEQEANKATRKYTHTAEGLAAIQHAVAIGKDAYLAERIAASVERCGQHDYTHYVAFAWAGRPDLALKQVETARKQGNLDVQMIEVQQPAALAS